MKLHHDVRSSKQLTVEVDLGKCGPVTGDRVCVCEYTIRQDKLMIYSELTSILSSLP